MDHMPFRSPNRSWIVPVIAGGASLVAYRLTLLPGVAFGDWGEMQTIPHVLGVAHPTGYPTYILLGWLAQLVPIGSIAFRANLLSAILVALTVATVSVILLRLDVRPVFAVTGSLAFGAVGTVWAAATVAEVNPLHLLLIALLIHRSLVWEARRSPIDIAIGGLLIGLALGNHLLTLFVAPFIVAFVVWVGRRDFFARPWLILVGVGAVAAGLSVYLYIPIAAALDPPLAYNHPVTLDSLVWLVEGTQFRDQFDFLTPAGPSELVGSLSDLWSVLVDRGTIVLPALGLLGLVILVPRRPPFGLMALGIVVSGVYVWANYLRLEHYLLVPWMFLGLGATFAIETLARVLTRMCRPRWRAAADTAIGIGTLVAVVVLASLNWQGADRSDDDGGEAYVRTMLDGLPQGAAILTPWDASTPLWHATFVRGERPDLLVIDDTNIVYEGWGSREARIGSLICDRPVYILRLRDGDLDATRSMFRLRPAFEVVVAVGGPTASTVRPVLQVLPPDPTDCRAV